MFGLHRHAAQVPVASYPPWPSWLLHEMLRLSAALVAALVEASRPQEFAGPSPRQLGKWP